MAYITRGRWFLTILQKKIFQKKSFAPFLGAFRGRFCQKLYMDPCNPILTVDWKIEGFLLWYVFVIITGLCVRHICWCIISGLRKYFEVLFFNFQVYSFLQSPFMRGEPLAIFFFKTYFWICNSMVVFPGPGRTYFSLKLHLKFDEIEKMKHCRSFGQYCRWTILCRKEGYTI